MEKDWKLKLRYGKLETPYKHFTVLAEGLVGDLNEDFECPKGNAWMSMKAWAKSTDESIDMIQNIGEQIGFKCNGKIEVYDTEPEKPPKDQPYGYDIKFTPFEDV